MEKEPHSPNIDEIGENIATDEEGIWRSEISALERQEIARQLSLLDGQISDINEDLAIMKQALKSEAVDDADAAELSEIESERQEAADHRRWLNKPVNRLVRGVAKTFIPRESLKTESERTESTTEQFVPTFLDEEERYDVQRTVESMQSDLRGKIATRNRLEQEYLTPTEINRRRNLLIASGVAHLASEETARDSEVEYANLFTEDMVLDEFEEQLSAGIEPDSLAQNMAGMDSERAWTLRAQLREKGASLACLVAGLSGIDTERAWQLRRELMHQKPPQNDFLAASLTGLDSNQGWQIRNRLRDNSAAELEIIYSSLATVDSDRAWQLRDHFINLFDGHKGQSYIARSLIGLDSEHSWEMRERLINNPNASLERLSASLAGLDSERAWEMRERLVQLGLPKHQLLRSLAGLDSERAWQMREEFIGDKETYESMAYGLAGLASEQASTMRERIFSEGLDPALQPVSVSGTYTTGLVCRQGL